MGFSRNEEKAYALGYRIDDEGIVYKPNGDRAHIRKDYQGYLIVTIPNRGSRGKDVKVHRFQGYKKHGDKIYTPGLVVCHFPDPKKSNNNINNLILDTNKVNEDHKPPEQKRKAGQLANKNKRRFSVEQVKEIRTLYQTGKSTCFIAKQYNVSHRPIYNIIKGKTYADVP